MLVEYLEDRYLAIDAETEYLVLVHVHLQIDDFHGEDLLYVEGFCSRHIPEEDFVVASPWHQCTDVSQLEQIADASLMPSQFLQHSPTIHIIDVDDGI